MAYEEITKSLIVAGRELLPSLFSKVRANFISHESRISALEGSNFALPPGVILARPSASLPTGFLLCDGSAVNRVNYAALFAVIGTTYGSGDGSTTFNLPDFRGRVPIGSGTGALLTNRTLGQKVGAETHTVSESEMATHSHTLTDPGHTHLYPHTHTAFGGGGSTVYPLFNNATASNANYGASGSPTQYATTGVTLSNTGGGGSHPNMQPSLVCNFVIKT